MGHYKTYISYVVQKGDHKQVLQWAEEKQKSLKQNENVIILNFFNVTNVK